MLLNRSDLAYAPWSSKRFLPTAEWHLGFMAAPGEGETSPAAPTTTTNFFFVLCNNNIIIEIIRRNNKYVFFYYYYIIQQWSSMMMYVILLIIDFMYSSMYEYHLYKATI